jgi:peptide/nickel transport system ATP-binding protein
MPTSESKSDAIAVSDLSVVFGEGAARNVAVDRVSFHVPEGGSFGLVGESGSGKSTVLRAIAGLIRDWTGSIAIEGENLGYLRERSFYRTVQMVFQDPYAS